MSPTRTKRNPAAVVSSEDLMKPKDVKTRIDADLHRRVVERAAAEDRSESYIVREALRQFLGDDQGGGRR